MSFYGATPVPDAVLAELRRLRELLCELQARLQKLEEASKTRGENK